MRGSELYRPKFSVMAVTRQQQAVWWLLFVMGLHARWKKRDSAMVPSHGFWCSARLGGPPPVTPMGGGMGIFDRPMTGISLLRQDRLAIKYWVA